MSSMPSLSGAFYSVLRRDLLLAFRGRNEWLNPLLFFLIVVSLFPLGVGPEPNQLQAMAPGVIWVSALLAAMLSLDGLFRGDFEDGCLEQLVLAPQPLPLTVLAKVFAHWLISGLPLTLLSPVLGMFMNLPEESYGVLMASLALGTPVLSLIGAIGSGLTVGLRRGGVLLSLLVLPLYIPVLIFGAGAVSAVSAGDPAVAHLAILGAMLAFSLVSAPLAVAAGLRISLE